MYYVTTIYYMNPVSQNYIGAFCKVIWQNGGPIVASGGPRMASACPESLGAVQKSHHSPDWGAANCFPESIGCGCQCLRLGSVQISYR